MEIIQWLRPNLENRSDALVLDLGCGDGRFSQMLLSQSWFCGKIRGYDQSSGMLGLFQTWLNSHPHYSDRVELIEADLQSENCRLPLANAIAIFQVGEFMPSFPTFLTKACQSLSFESLLVMTKPPDLLSYFFPFRGQTRKFIKSALQLEQVTLRSFIPWNFRYEFVVGQKTGPKLGIS